jgi:hypothetical protein
MPDQDKQQKIKVIGLYVIIILVMMRFLLYPLHGAVKSTKNVLADEYENYRVKQQLLMKYRQTGVAKPATDNSPTIAPRLYEKGIPIATIQAEVLEVLLKKAELYRLTVQNYEIPEAGGGNSVGVIPVIIRVKGPAEGIIEFLQAIPKEKKALAVQSMEVRTIGNETRYDLTIAAFRLLK